MPRLPPGFENLVQYIEGLAEGAVTNRIDDSCLVVIGDIKLRCPDAHCRVVSGDGIQCQLRQIMLNRQW